MLIGLIAGLCIAAGIWWKFSVPDVATAAQPASQTEAPTKPTMAKPPKPAELEATGRDYDFYEMLPEQEVIVHDGFAKRRDQPATTIKAAPEVIAAGIYRIQAGSFRNPDDAERMKAVLAMQGMKAQIEAVKVNNLSFYRVIIGPIKELNRLNEYQRRLAQANIDIQVTRAD